MSFIKSVVQSLIISILFMIVSLSLFVGNFPPSPKQIKNVYAQYQNMMKFKQQMMDQYANKDPAELVEAMERQQREALKALAQSRGGDPQYPKEVAQQPQGQRGPASATPPMQVHTNAVSEQIFQLQTELARLNQRVVELENQLHNQSQKTVQK